MVMHETYQPVSLSVLNKLENLILISEFIKETMTSWGLDENLIFDVHLAVDEACTNIIQYAYPDDQEGVIDIVCTLTQTSFVITIKDYGQPFDPLTLEDPTVDKPLEERGVGGLGVYFMKQLMDELHYHYKEADGYEKLTLVKHI